MLQETYTRLLNYGKFSVDRMPKPKEEEKYAHFKTRNRERNKYRQA